MPEATEEEWQHREERRMKDVEREKSYPDYEQYLKLVPKESRDDTCPKTPDPKDRSISKRQWKTITDTWKQGILAKVRESRKNSEETIPA